MHICVWLSVLLLVVFHFCETVEGRRTRFKPKPKPKKEEKAIEDFAPAKDFNVNQISGKWYLLTVASRCKHLLESGFKVESTIMTLTAPASQKAPLTVSTFRKLNYQCWEIKQQYETTRVQGRLLLKGNMPERDVQVTVIDTDYHSYAMFHYKRKDQITMKLYGRSTEISDAIVDKFEELAKKQNLGLDLVFQFPDYGFCDSADKEHVLVMT